MRLLNTSPIILDYNDAKYNVVANPKLVFSMNTFINFNVAFLDFPGAK
jgi:hypothetical protein